MSVVSELSALLSQSDSLKILSSVDSLCRSLAGKPYLLSSSFYPSFGLILHRLLNVSSSGSLPPLVCSLPRAWDLLRPSGSLFSLLFGHSSFPPKYPLPVSILPQQCRDFLHSAAGSSSSSALSASSSSSSSAALLLPGCPSVAGLLRSSYQPHSDCLQLSIHDYLFFSLALFLTRDLPAGSALLASLPRPAVPMAGGGGAAGGGSVSQHSSYQLTVDECYRSYLSLVQQYLALFLPHPAAAAASSAGIAGLTVANRSLYGESLPAILSELWMGDAASRMFELSTSSSLHSGSSFSGVSSSALPSPFASSSSSSPLSNSSASASSLSSVNQAATVSFSFPSLRVLGCVRALVSHLLSVPSAHSQVVRPSSSAATSLPSSVSSSSPSSLLLWPLSVSSVDVCLFRFLRSCLVHGSSQSDERYLSVVSVWLSVLTCAVASTSSPSALHVSFAFFSVLLVDFLRSLLDMDVGREGSAMRTACLKQCVQLMSLLQTHRADLERVEQLLLFGGMDGTRKGASRSNTRQPATFTVRPTLSSSATRTSTQQEADVIRANFMRLAAQLPDEQYARVYTRSAAQSDHVQQLVVQVVRYLTPASVRQGLAPLSLSHSSPAAAALSAGRSSAHLLQSTSAFRTQLIAEAQQFDKLTQLAVSTFDLPLDTIDEARLMDKDGRQDEASAAVGELASSDAAGTSSSDRSSAASAVRSLSPSRVRSDPYQRLSSTGRQQLARGVALCSKHSNSLRFVGSEWERPVASNECAAAVRMLHTLHSSLTAAAAASNAQLEGQQQHLQARLAQLPLRIFARWDVLISGGCAVLLISLVIAIAVMSGVE